MYWKNKGKKFLSVLLATALLVCLFPVVYAEAPDMDEPAGDVTQSVSETLEEVTEIEEPTEEPGEKPAEDPEDDPIETFSGMLSWSDGGFINGQGSYIDDENGINIRLEDESIDGSKINVMVWNNPDSGIKFDNGETVTTKLAISQSGWYYIYNITLSKDGAITGIKAVQLEQKTNAIYDLMGRKVSKMDKGIYIVNGKKYIVK